MAMFAVIEGTKVVNTIVADTAEIAQEATGADFTIIEFFPVTPSWTYVDGKFIEPVFAATETTPTENVVPGEAAPVTPKQHQQLNVH